MRSLFHDSSQVFALVIGVTDGILTALTLAAGRIFESSDPITIGLAFRISAASSASGIFVFFTAELIRLRGSLARAERQLNLTTQGRLATTNLGRTILIETAIRAVVSSTCNFFGALIPLIAGAIRPATSWLAIVIALVLLCGLGFAAGRAIHGNPILWLLSLLVAGVVLTVAGVKFRIV